MLSLFILGFAAVALVQFVVAQWRAIWLTSANQPLSDTFGATVGIEADCINESDFSNLLDLCRRQASGLKKISPWLPEVARYYSFLGVLRKATSRCIPSVSSWFAAEMAACSRYAAVALDHDLCIDLDRRSAARSL